MGSRLETMDELAPRNQRNMKRRLMESQVGAEVRRIHVIYFLSRKGRIEHPHLIRVHHLSRNGVHLRDVKRWLAELRGKEMPESFAWSYKRRYKNGYVWQDLLDDDLITPISDNEYVLKGSEISFNGGKDDSVSEKQSPTKEEISHEEEEEEEAKHRPISSPQEGNQHHPETKMDEPRKISSEIDKESMSFGSEKSTITEDSMKLEEDQDEHSQDQFKEEIHEEDDKNEDHSFCSSTSTSKKNKKGNNVNTDEKISTPASVSSTAAKSATFSRSKSYSNGASLLFRNLLSCGAVETNDSAMVTVSKRNKPSHNLSFTKQNHAFSTELTKGDKFGGSQRVFGTALNQQPQYTARRSFDGARSSTKGKSEFGNQKAIPACKPINGPLCSQCGKPFKPEKLHAHMKSCRGMKALAKGIRPAISATFADKASDRSSKSPFEDNPASGYYLMPQQ